MNEDAEKRLRPFIAHGVKFEGVVNDNAYGNCPFTGKDGKFYVNIKNLLWDSKTAGVSGNLNHFLTEITKVYVKKLTPDILKMLAENRKLPVEAFKPWQIGWNGMEFTISVPNESGLIQDIRFFKLGGHPMSTSGCQTGMLGLNTLKRNNEDPIYLCEGEWDGMAMSWLLSKNQVKGVVVAVPGASVFKQEWISFFRDRTVYAFYDNDAPGEEGELLLQKRLAGTAREVFYVHWPESFPEKADVRDWVVVGQKTPKQCYASLMKLLQENPRKLPEQSETKVSESGKVVITPQKTAWKKPPTLNQVFDVFKRWLFLDNTNAVEVMLATVMSNRIDGDPLWMFLVSPPGGAKTETLTSLQRCSNVFMTSSLTPHSLISGAPWMNGKDPSLIPNLDGKVLVIKDFTSILSKRDQERDEIFGILRDAYDGRCAKVFGTGVTKDYRSRFSILAAVTPKIYEMSAQHHSLGERFLKFLVGDNLEHHSEEDVIRRSILNIDSETKMRDELSDVVNSYIKAMSSKTLPVVREEMMIKLINLAMFGARMRGTVAREAFRPDIIISKPSAEVGSRLGKQLAKLGKSISLVNGRTSVTEYEYRLVRKTMLDTIPQRTEDILRSLFLKTPTMDDTLTTKEIAFITRYPQATVSRILSDMEILDIVKRSGTSMKYMWTVSPYIRKVIKGAHLYEAQDEIKRKIRFMVKLKPNYQEEAVPVNGNTKKVSGGSGVGDNWEMPEL